MTTPYNELRSLSQNSGLIELYILDMTAIGGTVYRFCDEAAADGGAVHLSGVPYYPMPIQLTGFGMNTTGAPLKPTLTVSNVSKELLSYVISLGDIVGATVQRIRIYAKNLDAGSNPDSTRIMGPETFIVDQKTGHSNAFISWNLSAPFDRPGTKLPIRQALRDPTSNSAGFPALARRRVT